MSNIDPNVMKYELSAACDIALKWFADTQMQANPNKFQGIIFSRNVIASKDYVLSVSEKDVECSKNVKLLGVDIDNKLTFTTHVQNICKKASRQVNVLSRMKYLLHESSKRRIFNAFVLSNLNYCPLVFHECGISNTKQLEKIQEPALRFTLNDPSATYNALLEKCKRNTFF